MKVNFGTESKEEKPNYPPWIGVDLDRTLASYDTFKGWDVIGVACV